MPPTCRAVDRIQFTVTEGGEHVTIGSSALPTGRHYLVGLTVSSDPSGPTRPGRVDAHPLRRRILEALAKDPGANLTELCRTASVARGTAAHHLYILERAGLVRSVVDGRERHFFPKAVDPRARQELLVLRKTHVEEIMYIIQQSPGIIQSQLTQRLDVSRKTFGQSIARLVEAGLVREERTNTRCAYYPTAELARLLKLRAAPPPSSSADDSE